MSDDAKAKERAATLKAQKERAQALDPALLECRIGGSRHRWIRCQPDVDVPRGQRVAVHQCEQCSGVKRTFFGARWGEIISRHYHMPKGYLLKRNEGEDGPLLSPAAVRLVLDAVEYDTPLPIVTPDFSDVEE